MERPSIPYLVRSFLFLGSTAFGGYTALVSMIKKKLVDEDRVLEEQVIFDGITIASILPGPLAVNVVTYIGYKLRGWPGALTSFSAIIFPSFVLITGLAWLYYTFSYIPEVSTFLAGVYPVIAAIILGVAWNFAQKHLKQRWQYLVFAIVLVVMFFFRGYWVLVACLAAGGVVGVFFRTEAADDSKTEDKGSHRGLLSGLVVVIIAVVALVLLVSPEDKQLFSAFSRISLTLFGGGYVMIPLIEALVVDQYGWLSSEEFYNAIAFGQVTPGPILISAAYVGFAHTGLVGALVSTIAIFLPSALLMVTVGALYQSISHVRSVDAALSGIRPVVIGLILFSVILVMKVTPLNVFTFASLVVSFYLISFLKVSFWLPMLASGLINVALEYF